MVIWALLDHSFNSASQDFRIKKKAVILHRKKCNLSEWIGRILCLHYRSVHLCSETFVCGGKARTSTSKSNEIRTLQWNITNSLINSDILLIRINLIGLFCIPQNAVKLLVLLFILSTFESFQIFT